MTSGCGTAGRGVASFTREPRFESSARESVIKYVFMVNCIERKGSRVVVVAQLLERSLPRPEFRGSNRVISNVVCRK